MPKQTYAAKEQVSEHLRLVDRKLAHSFGWDGTERRRHFRFSVQWNGVLDCVDSEYRVSAEVRVSDISEGGCCIVLRTPSGEANPRVLLGSEGQISLRMFLSSGVVNALVDVRWYMPIEDDAYAAGMQWLSMSARDRSLLRSAIQEAAGARIR